MTIALRQATDPRALIEASQAVRDMLGTLPPVPGSLATRRSRIGEPSSMTPGCMNGLKWPDRDIRKLEEQAGKVPVELIAAAVWRTPSAVKAKAHELGLFTRIYRTKWLPVPINPARSRRIFAGCYSSMRPIIRKVSEETGVSIDELLSRRKTKDLAKTRRVLLWTLARDTKLSLSQLGERLRLDHTSIRYAILNEDAERGSDVFSMRSRKNEGRPL